MLTTAATANASTILTAALRGVTRATRRTVGAASSGLRTTLSLYRCRGRLRSLLKFHNTSLIFSETGSRRRAGSPRVLEDGSGRKLLRDARGVPERRRGRHQEGLPPAGPPLPPGRQPGQPGRREGSSRRSRRPTPSCRTTTSARQYDTYGSVDSIPDVGFDPFRRSRGRAEWQDLGGYRIDLGDLGGMGDVGDLFGEFFGGATGRQPAGPPRAATTRARCEVDFVDAVRGTTVALPAQRQLQCADCGGSGSAKGGSCPSCRGSGIVISTERLRVKIPEGIADGNRVRVPGKGSEGAGGGAAGDLFVRVSVRPHPYFKRDGDNILTTVPITFTEAYRGAEIEVGTIHGPVRAKVPPGTDSGRVFPAAGQGCAQHQDPRLRRPPVHRRDRGTEGGLPGRRGDGPPGCRPLPGQPARTGPEESLTRSAASSFLSPFPKRKVPDLPLPRPRPLPRPGRSWGSLREVSFPDFVPAQKVGATVGGGRLRDFGPGR